MSYREKDGGSRRECAVRGFMMGEAEEARDPR